MGQVIGLMSGDDITIQDVLCEKVIFFFLLFFFFGSWIVEGNAKNYFIDEWNKGNWSWFHGYSFSMCKWIFFAKYYYEPFQLFVFLPSVLELICVNCLIKGY